MQTVCAPRKDNQVIWQSGSTTVADMSGSRSYLFRFHTDEEYIPGDVLSNCTVVEVAPGECEIQAWGGRRGPTTRDRRDITAFCRWKGFRYAYWWRFRNGRTPKFVLLFDDRTLS